METFWKAAVVVILTVILGLTFEKTQKDLAVALSAVACCLVLMAAMGYFQKVIRFLWELGTIAGEGVPFLGTLLEILGVALVTEMTGLLSSDAGNSALGKAVRILGNAGILFLSLPLLEAFLAIVQEILGSL